MATIVVDLTNDDINVSEKKRKIEQIPVMKSTNKVIKTTSITDGGTVTTSVNDTSIWLVVHFKEPYYHSAWSYDSHLRYGPSTIDKVIVGVYKDYEAAKISCKNYWKSLNKPHGEDGCGGTIDDFEDGYFYDAMSLIGDVNVINERVCIEKHDFNRPAKIRVTDKKLLNRKGKM